MVVAGFRTLEFDPSSDLLKQYLDDLKVFMGVHDLWITYFRIGANAHDFAFTQDYVSVRQNTRALRQMSAVREVLTNQECSGAQGTQPLHPFVLGEWVDTEETSFEGSELFQLVHDCGHLCLPVAGLIFKQHRGSTITIRERVVKTVFDPRPHFEQEVLLFFNVAFTTEGAARMMVTIEKTLQALQRSLAGEQLTNEAWQALLLPADLLAKSTPRP